MEENKQGIGAEVSGEGASAPNNGTAMLNDQVVDKEYEQYFRENNNNSIKTDGMTLLGVLVGSVINAVQIGIFVDKGGLTPGGLSGVAVLAQRFADKLFGLSIPFFPISIALNLAAAAFAFKTLGKKYIAFSFLSVLLYSVLTDMMPDITITDDRVLLAVFGGILAGTSCSLILNSGASQGGTDFIAMTFSVKYGINTFNYVMAFNIALIIVSGVFFSMEDALYTIIYQFVSTQVLNFIYRRYAKRTLFIVTSKPQKISHEIRSTTNHSCTIFEGEGGFSGQKNYLVYMIVGADELNFVRKKIKTVDNNAFINVINSSMVTGNFYIRSLR